ncbi:MAG: hypothetical protein KAQ85_01485 [Thermodesulfovibrionia bacterium]|nr:hypothetical protein [Thermodesulfovibrionia bacterium]
MEIHFQRNGQYREWYDSNKKYHKEEVIDVFIGGKKLSRGLCLSVFGKILPLELGEAKITELVLK